MSAPRRTAVRSLYRGHKEKAALLIAISSAARGREGPLSIRLPPAQVNTSGKGRHRVHTLRSHPLPPPRRRMLAARPSAAPARALRAAPLQALVGRRCGMSRGRRVPPPFIPVTGVNPSLGEMIRIGTQPGLLMLRFEHNDGCRTI